MSGRGLIVVMAVGLAAAPPASARSCADIDLGRDAFRKVVVVEQSCANARIRLDRAVRLRRGRSAWHLGGFRWKVTKARNGTRRIKGTYGRASISAVWTHR